MSSYVESLTKFVLSFCHHDNLYTVVMHCVFDTKHAEVYQEQELTFKSGLGVITLPPNQVKKVVDRACMTVS